MGAEVLALFVAPEYQYPVYVEIIPPTTPARTNMSLPDEAPGEEYMGSIMRAAQAAA